MNKDKRVKRPGKHKHRALLDFVIVVTVTVTGTFLLAMFDAYEKFHEVTRDWEEWEFDDITIGVFVLSICLSWFSFRRWRVANREIERRKVAEEALEKAYKGELVITARKAGMAEVATGVLHNVGNVLNSIGVTTVAMTKIIKNSRVSYLSNVTKALEDNVGNIGDFIQTDVRGKRLPEYIGRLSESLKEEQEHLLQRVEKLGGYVHHITDIINLQHSYSKTGGVSEPVLLNELMEDALRINMEALIRHSVAVKKEYVQSPPILCDRGRVLQILTNLISNAKYALSRSPREDKFLTLSINKPEGGRIQIRVTDNGIGISEENLSHVFKYGFTTRENGHGFGLHSSAAVAEEMGGTLSVHSGGPGKGAVFTLELPFKPGGKIE
ncbi:MAG: HAMP domain-containing histidine kinase [bacterium]|nr:HAMP domain-containing histidine kinase [bacterium]